MPVASGNRLSPARLNALNAPRRGCRLRRAAAQSVNSATTTTISWDTEDDDIGGYFSSGSPTVVTIPSGLGGLYGIIYRPFVASLTVAGRCFGSINVTTAIVGMPSIYRIPFDVNEDQIVVPLGGIPLLSGDSFTCDVFHSHGSARDVTAFVSCYLIGA